MSHRVITSDTYHSPRNLILPRWDVTGTVFVGKTGGVTALSVFGTDPNANGFTESMRTGVAGIDGLATIGLTNGFTASSASPMLLYCWEFNKNAQAWFLLGANSGRYVLAYDTNYALDSFRVAEQASFLVQSASVITGNVYMDSKPS